MLIEKKVEYKGCIHLVVADITFKHRRVTVDGVECKQIIKTFGCLRSCFVTRTVLNDEDVIVIIYGRYVSIEACPKGQFKAYSSQRLAPPIGTDFVFQIISLFALCPILGEAYYLLTYYSIGWALPSALLFGLCYLVLTYITYHPGIGKIKRMILWLLFAVMFNISSVAYLLLVTKTMN